MRKNVIVSGMAALLLAAGLAGGQSSAAQGAEAKDVVASYANIAAAKYDDSLATARGLQSAIDAFLKAPGQSTHDAAKQAWLDARVPYQQTEVYRFGNAIVDDWEGKVNAWPLDEGLIDYVDESYGVENQENLFYTANVIANPKLVFGGIEIDAMKIDQALIRSLHEVDGIEADVATGYHAIEFLLWGQDLNGTGPGAGARPWTDYALDRCTGGNCERRRDYLKAAADLLVADLEEMAAAWRDGGAARQALAAESPERGLTTILVGMGSLSFGELAGERMKLGLLLHDPEEEHDCFSDNTANSHYYDALGIRNVYLGAYKRVDGSVVQGASLSDLVKAKSPKLDAEMRAKLDATVAAMAVMKETSDSGQMAYDQMIGEGNDKGNAMVQAAIDALLDQTKTIEKVVAALELDPVEFESSDSLVNPSAVFK
jgi:putative iron-regulated protein